MKRPLLQDDAFLADVAAARDAKDGSFRLWWLGQSGFLLQHRGRHVLFDPYLSDSLTLKYANTEKPHVRMSERVVQPERLDFIDIITSTHNHTDHLDATTLVPLIRAAQSRWDASLGATASESLHPILLFPEANRRVVEERLANVRPFLIGLTAWERETHARFEFIPVPAGHEELATDELGRHFYLGYVVKFGRWTVYHSGDTVVYAGMADALRPLDIDVAILPINGKVGNMSGRDAARLAKDIRAQVVIPCHYDMFEFNTADPADEFIPECERLGLAYRVLRLGERFGSTEIPG